MLIGSLCTGYGGLDSAVQQVFNGQLAWVSDNHVAASKLLTYRYQDICNLGDLTDIKWEKNINKFKINILTAGFPCQPFSMAGEQKGLDDDRWIWPSITECIRVLRPEYIFLENVANIVRHAIGNVLGDLAGLGYDAEWCCVRASDAGAPHTRNRWFCFAYTKSMVREHIRQVGGTSTGSNEEKRSLPGWDTIVDSSESTAYTKGTGLERTWREELQIRFPSRRASNPYSTGLERDTRGQLSSWESSTRDQQVEWGRYTTAVRSWENQLGRCAPVPMTESKNHKPRINPQFVEWMMGLENGWVTDVPGLSYREQLHLLGNGVVPQQAAYALTRLLGGIDSLVVASAA